jgi:hypothetical protein
VIRNRLNNISHLYVLNFSQPADLLEHPARSLARLLLRLGWEVGEGGGCHALMGGGQAPREEEELLLKKGTDGAWCGDSQLRLVWIQIQDY